MFTIINHYYPLLTIFNHLWSMINHINLAKFHHDLTATKPWNHGFHKEDHPQIALI